MSKRATGMIGKRVNGFMPGDRVEMTAEAVRYGVCGSTRPLGTVKVVWLTGPYITVLRDNCVNDSLYHISFWKLTKGGADKK